MYFIWIKLPVDNQNAWNAIMNCNLDNTIQTLTIVLSWSVCPISNLDFLRYLGAAAAAEMHEAVEHSHHGDQNLIYHNVDV